MTDRAPEVAAYLVEQTHDDIGLAELWVAMRERWPDLTVEEAQRGIEIADEILGASIAETMAEVDAAEARLTQRHRP